MGDFALAASWIDVRAAPVEQHTSVISLEK